MKVSGLYIYPIKSLGGISVTSAKTLTEGLEYDRRWMLVDADGRFFTQREHPHLALFGTKLHKDQLQITYQGDELTIPLAQHDDTDLRVSVWSSKLKASQVSADASSWFSDHLDAEVKLVRMTTDSKRPKRLFTEPYKTQVSLADGYPYLILGTASMNELNNKLSSPLSMDRFRANIIVDTSEPHEEDTWKEEFTLGETTMKVIKPCARCVMTTIDQKTAAQGKEPLKTLATYRKKRNKIWFGANAICLKEGEISVGDSLSL